MTRAAQYYELLKKFKATVLIICVMSLKAVGACAELALVTRPDKCPSALDPPLPSLQVLGVGHGAKFFLPSFDGESLGAPFLF